MSPSTSGTRINRIVDAADPTTVTLLPIRTSVPIRRWRTSNVTLAGDAIHSMTPFRGVGGNLALHDAHLLCRNLIAVDRGDRPLLRSIDDYEKVMVRRGFAAVRASLRTSRAVHSDSRLFCTATNALMRAVNGVPPDQARRRTTYEQPLAPEVDR